MTKPITIAIDAMGGDNAPDAIIRGVHLAARRRLETRFIVVGDRARIEPLLRRYRRILGERATIEHTAEVVAAEDKPSVALRRGRKTSMRLAIDAVADGRAQAVISAGNTGALMAMAKVVLRTLPGIDRPAIAGVVPHRRGEGVFLDLGANIECDAGNLVDFAIMGAVFARAVLGRINPLVGILNVGNEELKGHDEVRQAAAVLREAKDLPLIFHGFVEGDDIAEGTTDVVVTDGFSGNVALKTAEGVSRMYADFVKRALLGSWRGRLGYLIARSAFRAVRQQTDPRHRNGAMFLGVNGTVVKSHGGTDALGFAAAVEVAADAVAEGINQRIIDELAHLHAAQGSGEPAREAAGS
ncbi:MAG TPA: phosphate acyltransferase PlsX [Alphaproteobacteria bacterium]